MSDLKKQFLIAPTSKDKIKLIKLFIKLVPGIKVIRHSHNFNLVLVTIYNRLKEQEMNKRSQHVTKLFEKIRMCLITFIPGTNFISFILSLE